MTYARRRNSDLVIALGGGVVGDITGFAAWQLSCARLFACARLHILLAHSSVGGKTGVDLAEGKNLVGAISPQSSSPALCYPLPDATFPPDGRGG